MFGKRVLDINELDKPNDTVKDATRLRTSSKDGFDGTTPAVAYGDISDVSDVDFFRFYPIKNYEGNITLTVRTQGISLLQPQLTVFNRDGELIASTQSTNSQGDTISVHLPSAKKEKYALRIEAADGAVFDVGGYSISVVFDDLVKSLARSIEIVSGGGRFRSRP